MAFESRRDGNPEIYVMNADGSAQRRLTHDPAQDIAASWSPDGTQIVWGATRRGSRDLTMDAEGTNVRQLITRRLRPAPAWSPDGGTSSHPYRGAYFRIYAIARTGEMTIAVGSGPLGGSPPLVLADGERIAFESNRSDNSQI